MRKDPEKKQAGKERQKKRLGKYPNGNLWVLY